MERRESRNGRVLAMGVMVGPGDDRSRPQMSSGAGQRPNTLDRGPVRGRTRRERAVAQGAAPAAIRSARTRRFDAQAGP
jgi:hypothetical protein